MNTDPPPPSQSFQINIGSNTGTAVFGNQNVIHVSTPSLTALGLPPEQFARIEAALKALEAGHADQPDAQALKAAAGTPDAAQRQESIKAWLLKMAPAALGLAGSLVNPVVGELAKAAGQWAAKALGIPSTK